MSRPSEPLLKWLRDTLKTKGLNTAHVAEASGLARNRVRKILAGDADMSVDELMMLSDALQLDPSDLTGQNLPMTPEPTEEVDEDESDEDEATAPLPQVDPWGNQPEQLFRIAFDLGCDFFFLVDTSQLQESGIPASVLEQYSGRELPIKLEAAYHKYNEPRYSEEGIALTLSFDALYECTFQWSAVKQFVLFPMAPDPDQAREDANAPKTPAGPHLRLVT